MTVMPILLLEVKVSNMVDMQGQWNWVIISILLFIGSIMRIATTYPLWELVSSVIWDLMALVS